MRLGGVQAFRRLSDRVAGRVDSTLHGGVPEWLVAPLRKWIDTACRVKSGIAEEVCCCLRITAFDHRFFIAALLDQPDDQLLEVVDAVLQVGGLHETHPDLVEKLERLLFRGGSAWRVDDSGRRLVRRVNPIVKEAFVYTVRSAPEEAAEHLCAAWRAVYGREPNPDVAYSEAVKAVEAVACPLVLPGAADGGSPTLGVVIKALRDGPHKWRLGLADRRDEPRGVGEFVGMLDVLWQGHRSRHAGSTTARQQTQKEAEAAVQLAVLLVQWLGGGMLQRVE